MANENQLNPRELGNIFENIFDASKENKVEALIVLSTIRIDNETSRIVGTIFGKPEDVIDMLYRAGLKDKKIAAMLEVASEALNKKSFLNALIENDKR